MNDFLFALEAVLPIVLLIFLGYQLKRIKFYDEHFLKIANKLVFKVLLPVLLFYNIYSISSLKDIKWPITIFAVLIMIAIFVIGIVVVKLLVKDNKRKGVVLQCIFRSNFAIIGLPLATAIGGVLGKEMASVLSAVIVPVNCILAVLALSIFNNDENNEKKRVKSILKTIVTNPIIIGVLIGVVVVGIREFIPTNSDGNKVFTIKDNLKPLFIVIRDLGVITSPLSLLVLGGQFKFSAIKGMTKEIILGTLLRIVIVPFAALLVLIILVKNTNIIIAGPGDFAAMLALFGSPVAVSSAIMAKEMNNDDQLAGQLVVWTSVFSTFTIFIAIVILRSMGYL